MFLNENQIKFCDYYLKLGSISKASEQAGYHKKRGYELIKQPKIKEYINFKLKEMTSDNIADKDEIMKYLTKVMRGEDEDKISIRERLKAAELLGKTYCIFSAKNEEKISKAIIISGEDEILE